MRKLQFFGCSLASLLLLAACERGYRELGNKKPTAGSPVFTSEEKVFATPALASLKSVAPHGKGPDGGALYAANCSACHQSSGQGLPGVFPPLDASAYVTGPNLERLASILIYGLQGPIKVNGNTYNNVMAPLGRLSDEELAAIASYTRGAWSNKADAVGTEIFAAARTKWGSRAMFNIQELGEEN